VPANEAARRLRELDVVRQLLARAARDALAFGESLAAPSTGDDRVRRELLAHLARGVAEGVADALEAVNEMADELAELRQHDLPNEDRGDA
jgi:hypothetical protein